MATILLISSQIGFGQTTVAVAPVKMNVFYIGVDNPVSVATSGAADDKVTISIKGGGGKAEKIAAGLYIVRVSDLTDECIVNVYTEGKLAGSSTFRVRNIPAHSVTVGGMPSGSNIKSEVFRKQAGIGIFVKDFAFELNYDIEIVSFTLAVDSDKEIVTTECQGSLFSSEARQALEKYAIPGHMVTIDNIRTKQGGTEYKTPSLVYYIN